MARRTPKPGDVYRYAGDEPLGIDSGALLPDTEVTVREVVKAAEQGAHDDLEDAVVVEWTAPGIVEAELELEPYVVDEVHDWGPAATGDVELPEGHRVVEVPGRGRRQIGPRRRVRALRRFGPGEVPRAMSVGLETLAEVFEEVRRAG